MRNMKRNNGGFTLIELMIVVTIIAILAAVGYPGYQNHVLKARRTDAKSNLLELAQYMERFFTETGSYCANSPPDSPCTTAPTLPFTKSPKDGSNQFYTFAFTAGMPTATAYTLQATPEGGQLKDTQCGALSIDSTGVKCALGGTRCSNNPAHSEVISTCW